MLKYCGVCLKNVEMDVHSSKCPVCFAETKIVLCDEKQELAVNQLFDAFHSGKKVDKDKSAKRFKRDVFNVGG